MMGQVETTATGVAEGTGTDPTFDATKALRVSGAVTATPSAVGAGTAAAAARVTLASDDPAVASLASLVNPGLSASVSVTRTNDTNAYTANDVLGAATGSTAALTFALAADSGSNILITSVAFERDVSALISGETNYLLHLYNVTPPSALGDNAAFDLPSGDRASYLGSINLGTPVDLGSTLYIEQNAVNKQVKLAGTSLFAYLVTVGAYTPTAQAVHKVTVNAVQL